MFPGTGAGPLEQRDAAAGRLPGLGHAVGIIGIGIIGIIGIIGAVADLDDAEAAGTEVSRFREPPIRWV